MIVVHVHQCIIVQFYKCANGTLTLETCGNGLLFDESRALAGSAHNHCAYNWEAECGARPADNTPISTPGCEYQFGIFPSGEGCFASYTKCANGIPKEVENDIINLEKYKTVFISTTPLLKSINVCAGVVKTIYFINGTFLTNNLNTLPYILNINFKEMKKFITLSYVFLHFLKTKKNNEQIVEKAKISIWLCVLLQ